jgi:hypothetical protein
MTTPTPSRSRNKRLLLATFLVAAWACLVVVIVMRGHTSRDRSAAAAPPPPTEPETAVARPTLALPAAAPPSSEPPEDRMLDAPIIDEIRVEHQEVCEGEENLVTVKAHTPAGRGDAFLHYFIGTGVGRAVPVRAFLPQGEATPGPMTIQVFGRDNVATSAPMPAYTVKRCQPDRSLFLRSRQMPNSTDELELVATIRELGPSAPLRVTAYRWAFGDGEQTVTAGPSAVHRFGVQDPNALYSEFLVTCEAVGGDGRTVVGRTALSLRNAEFENLEFQKTLVLSVELTPRFPQLDSHGRVVQTVRLYHHRDAPVRLEQARVTYVEGFDGQEVSAEPRSVAELLGSDEVLPGHGAEHTFRFDPAAHPGTRMVDYVFEGHTADGIPAIASFSVMVPPPSPTPDTGTPITDPLLSQKIMRARERLGRPFVNDEDLMQLEQEGAFADLKSAASPSGEAPPAGALTPAQLKAALAAKAGHVATR